MACVMIILMHSPMPRSSAFGPLLSGISYLTAPGIGLFFMVSGALLLRKRDDSSPFDFKDYLRRRFSKIFWPTLFWTIIGGLLEYWGIHNAERKILWFMYAIAGLYLLAPILIRWLSNACQGEIEFYLIIWMVSLCYPYLQSFFVLDQSVKSWIFYFQGYAGYFVLGAYLSRFKISRVYLHILKILFLAFSIILPLLTLVMGWQVNFYSWFWYLSLSVTLQCVLWWLLLRRFALHMERFRNTITAISKLSFGIYLVHVFVLHNFLWKMPLMQELPSVLQILVCTILTFLLSAGICWCLSKWKYSKYIIGI